MTRNTKTLTATLLTLAILLGLTPPARAVGTSRATAGSKNAAGSKQGVKRSFAQLPSFFEENAGQADARAKFISRGAGHTLMLGSGGVTLALLKGGGKEGSGRTPLRAAPGENARGTRAPEPSYQLVGMRFVGANPRPEIVGAGELAARVNYFVGRDASKWRPGLKTFAGVRYRGLYPGVDLVFHEIGRA